MLRQRLSGLFFVLLAFVLWSPPADASLMGSTLAWQYYAYGGPYNSDGQTAGSWVVNGGVGGTFIGFSGPFYFDIIADDTSITFDYIGEASTWSPSPLSLAPTVHNGLAIDLLSGPVFSNVTINPSTNMVGFDVSRFSFTGTQIQVDWENLSFNSDTIVKLDVTTGGPVIPEPSSLLLVGSGLAGLVAARRRRRS